MKAAAWKSRIKKACEAAGTYRAYFDGTIRTLASILEQRDRAYDEWQQAGAPLTEEYTNKAGASNVVPHPLMNIWDDLNKSALAYWRDLGLTPAGLKKINENAMKKKKESGLAAALRDLSG